MTAPPAVRRWLRPPAVRGLTRTPLALQIFHHLLGGGGFDTPPRLSRLLLVVYKNENKRLNARQK